MPKNGARGLFLRGGGLLIRLRNWYNARGAGKGKKNSKRS